MSETIGEMILPGTYIDVRSEGLIGVGGIAVGNVGVVGTASRGPINTVQVLGSYAEALDTFGDYDRWDPAASPANLTLTRTLEQVFRGGASTVYAVRIAAPGGSPMASAQWRVRDGTGGSAATLFTLTAQTAGTWANAITAKLDTPVGAPVKLTLTFPRPNGSSKESFEGANAKELAAAVNATSRYVTASAPAVADETKVPAAVDSAPNTAGGPNGAGVSTTDVATGLDQLATQDVNILVIGGMNMATAAATVLGHLDATETDGRERIAVLGASSDTPSTIASSDVPAGSNPRLILVAPGILANDAARVGEQVKQVQLSAPYAAALVAGRIASLAPHISLTNKDVPVDGLTTDYTRAQQKQLLGKQVLVVYRGLGTRVLKGITTDTGAFKQISVRRIVDYAKQGVRLGSNPYIGKLNNARVRAALKATLDGFLSGMILDEMLQKYTLDVSATRAQEINGICLVTMTLQPTFSIDFVKVIMTLE
ncbi:MAG TPA: phage tail sheath C-terminal domain-containing protein [Kofleriaceae bacterium]|nr:phage tail sheath C-terminal domain-containing protein [Kofleriaceae bacterium]